MKTRRTAKQFHSNSVHISEETKSESKSTKYTTWFAPDGLTPAKALKAAEQAAEEWEAKIKEEYERDVIDPIRVREREINEGKTPFTVFTNDIWFPIDFENLTIDIKRNVTYTE